MRRCVGLSQWRIYDPGALAHAIIRRPSNFGQGGGVQGRGQDGKVGPPVDPVTRRGSGGITPGKFLKIYVNFGAIWCIFAPLAESLDSPVLQQNFKVCDSL